MLVVGDRESAEGQVAVRGRADGDLGAFTVDTFIELAKREVENKGKETIKGSLETRTR
jgi:threonyl-tRNA synthetase